MAKEKFLAVAFTDTNGNDKFDPKKGDALIAGIVDTDKSKDVSLDDTVVFGTYPLNFNPTSAEDFGSFQPTPTSGDITAFNTQAGLVEIGTAEGTLTWVSEDDLEAFLTESPGTDALIEDTITGSFFDFISVTEGAGPGTPDTAVPTVFSETQGNGDQGFLDVLFA